MNEQIIPSSLFRVQSGGAWRLSPKLQVNVSLLLDERENKPGARRSAARMKEGLCARGRHTSADSAAAASVLCQRRLKRDQV